MIFNIVQLSKSFMEKWPFLGCMDILFWLSLKYFGPTSIYKLRRRVVRIIVPDSFVLGMLGRKQVPRLVRTTSPESFALSMFQKAPLNMSEAMGI